jgi:D-threo-aldose 1-dehydrogenase
VPLKAAALQLPAAHPVIAAVLIGARSRREVTENVALFDLPIPAELWRELKAEQLLADIAPTPAVCSPT